MKLKLLMIGLSKECYFPKDLEVEGIEFFLLRINYVVQVSNFFWSLSNGVAIS